MSSITSYYNSPIGPLEIISDENGVSAVSFASEKITPNKTTPPKNITEQLDKYFAGKEIMPMINIRMNGTELQLAVWEEVMKIAYGNTISYSELAQRIGKPGAVRAVASAVGANKLAIFIPCHRVIGKNGSLTGYRWGIDKKSQLLAHEREHQSPSDNIPNSLFAQTV